MKTRTRSPHIPKTPPILPQVPSPKKQNQEDESAPLNDADMRCVLGSIGHIVQLRLSFAFPFRHYLHVACCVVLLLCFAVGTRNVSRLSFRHLPSPSSNLHAPCDVVGESRHHPGRRAGLGRAAAGAGARRSATLARQVVARRAGRGVVVLPVDGLHEIQRVAEGLRDVRLELADDDRTDNQDHHQEEHEEVHDGVADDAALAQLRLLERVDRRADLAAVDIVSTWSTG